MLRWGYLAAVLCFLAPGANAIHRGGYKLKRLKAADEDTPAGSPAISKGLMHRASPTGHDSVMGLCVYPKNIMGMFRGFAGTLRLSGYDGHIILGVSPTLSEEEHAYLKKMEVTYYAVETGPCDFAFDGSKGLAEASEGTKIRHQCDKHHPKMKLEWGRYEMALEWLKDCEDCTGWSLVCDVKDSFFYHSPFKGLGTTSAADDDKNIFIIEEWNENPASNNAADHPRTSTNQHWFSWKGVYNCYGNEKGAKIVNPYRDSPIVCSGSTVATRKGMLHYLTVIVDEYYALVEMGERCIPPNIWDQAIHTYLWYQGRFGPGAKAMPYGEGTVLTVGLSCTDNKGGHSLLDVVERDSEGFLLLNDGTRPGMIHQYNRCNDWMVPWMYNFCQKLHGAAGYSSTERCKD